MESEQKLTRRQFLKNAAVDARLFAEGAAAIYVALLRERTKKISGGKKNLEINDPINIALLAGGMLASSIALARRLPTLPGIYGGSR